MVAFADVSVGFVEEAVVEGTLDRTELAFDGGFVESMSSGEGIEALFVLCFEGIEFLGEGLTRKGD
jgi:hypothetical protein